MGMLQSMEHTRTAIMTQVLCVKTILTHMRGLQAFQGVLFGPGQFIDVQL